MESDRIIFVRQEITYKISNAKRAGKEIGQIRGKIVFLYFRKEYSTSLLRIQLSKILGYLCFSLSNAS